MIQRLLSSIAGWAFARNQRRISMIAHTMRLIGEVRGQAIAALQVATATGKPVSQVTRYEGRDGYVSVHLTVDSRNPRRQKLNVCVPRDTITRREIEQLLRSPLWLGGYIITATEAGFSCTVELIPSGTIDAYLQTQQLTSNV